MRSLRWMSIALMVDTDVLMDEGHKVMVLGSSTDVVKNVLNDAEVDGTDG